MESLNLIFIKNYFNQFSSLFDKSPIIYFCILIFLSFIAAKIIDIIFLRFLTKLVSKTRTNIDDKIISILHKPFYYSLLFVGFNLSIKSLLLSDKFIFIISALLKSYAIIIWSIALLKIFLLLIDWYSSKSKSSKTVNLKLLPLFDNIGKIIIFLSAAYFMMISWGVNPVGWLASAGVLGIVLGLAAKDTLANLFSGIFIMMDSPYKEGDYINLDSGERGYVVSIGIRSTRIMTRDDVEITIPNTVIANAKIINESGGPYENERIRLSVGVAYGSDIEKVRKILIDIAKNCDLVSKSFEPRVRFREFGESSLNFQLLFWIESPEAKGRTLDSLNTSIYNAFNEYNIEIPFPQRTVHLKK